MSVKVVPTLFTHAALSRPRMVPIGDTLPKGAAINRRYTPWQEIVGTLVKHRGTWFELSRRYTSISTAMAGARKVLDADYPTDIASRLESASLVEDGMIVVYLRIAGPAEGGEDEGEDDA